MQKRNYFFPCLIQRQGSSGIFFSPLVQLGVSKQGGRGNNFGEVCNLYTLMETFNKRYPNSIRHIPYVPEAVAVGLQFGLKDKKDGSRSI